MLKLNYLLSGFSDMAKDSVLNIVGMFMFLNAFHFIMLLKWCVCFAISVRETYFQGFHMLFLFSFQILSLLCPNFKGI